MTQKHLQVKRFVIHAILARRGFFSLDQIAESARLSRGTVRTALNALCSAGLVTRISLRRGMIGEAIRYRGINTKLRKALEPKLQENTAADAMWKVIRFKKVFQTRDLRVIAGATKENARWFIKMLRRAGYIKERPGQQWVLTEDPGVRRPYVGR